MMTMMNLTRWTLRGNFQSYKSKSYVSPSVLRKWTEEEFHTVQIKKLNALLWFLRNANWIVCYQNRCNGIMKYVSGHIEFETPSWKSTNFRTSFWLVSALMNSAVWLLSRAFSWRELDSPSGWVFALFGTLSTATGFYYYQEIPSFVLISLLIFCFCQAASLFLVVVWQVVNCLSPNPISHLLKG